MEIKVYTKADEKAVLELWTEFAAGMSEIVDRRIDIQERLTTPSQLFFVANVEEIAVGTALACITDGIGQLDYLAVKPEHQRKGIGGRLVKQAEKTLAEMGCSNLSICIDAADESMMGFFASVGYQLQGIVNLGKNITNGSSKL